jgi:hypothetical protein
MLEALMGRRLRRLARDRERAAPEARFSTRLPRVFAEQEELIARYAPGRSFLDVACLWEMHGSCAFLAEELGATRVTASDMWPASAEYEALHAERSSAVSFAEANLHDADAVRSLGRHDVVWCSGMLYHTPIVLQVIVNLLEIAGEYLILGSKVLPSVPGLPGAAVYYPALDAADRERSAPVSRTVATEPFQPEAHGANWYWGLTPELVVGMTRSVAPVELVEEVHLPWRRRHDSYYAVLRRRPAAAAG